MGRACWVGRALEVNDRKRGGSKRESKKESEGGEEGGRRGQGRGVCVCIRKGKMLLNHGPYTP